ncbi:hypothetical protein LTR66_002469 [Elasticomyces elasticus]|nr:hypothetical protein LTR28_012186 [Elasticomyces elasticus]KAK4998288.1 hypothetical protein LTR66_002469 [Elasticomyces elasticus]
MPCNSLRFLVVLALLATQTLAAVTDWLSPVYQNFYEFPLPIPPVKVPKTSYTNSSTGVTIDYYEVEIKPLEQQIYPGLKKARLIGYDGISPGPTFHMEKGREAVVRFINRQGDRANSVHLHGSYSRAPFDGWAEDTTEVGQYKDYYYPNGQNARTLWYHDHAIHHTAENAYYGQAGFYILHDPSEDLLHLPSGDYDVPLGLSSKQYNTDGTLFDPVNEVVSLWGDVIHVNGQPWPYLNVEPRKYRFRFLDSSISRSFKLYFEADSAVGTNIPFNVIASDAGLLTKPVPTDNLEISIAERWEIIFDFSAYAGKNVTLRNSRKVQADEDYNSTDKVMRFVVGSTPPSTVNNGNLPSTFRTVPFPPPKTGVDRTFRFERSNGQWQINGVVFSDIANRILAKPPRGAVEVWELQNGGGGWSHPVHIRKFHSYQPTLTLNANTITDLIDFQIISRSGARTVTPYEREALKDVVWLGTSETVQVIARYAPWDGVYMFHCHNLIHEDHDMMAAFNVSVLDDFGYQEKTHFLDPMEPRWRSKPINDQDFQPQAIQDRLAEFGSLDAYNKAGEVEVALEGYWSTHIPVPTSLATSVRSSSSGTVAGTATGTVIGTATVTVSPASSTSRTSTTRGSSTATN